ncbi:MAG: acyl-CoA thioesterase [Sphingobacteriales bacterium]|nr:acyl-CoA thioesterase [Sphingobacteriales bacterium]
MSQIDFSLFRYQQPLAMRWSDLDELGHANNAVYLTYFEEARVGYFAAACQWDWKKDGLILAKATVNYRRPLFFVQTAQIALRCSHIGNKSFELQYAITAPDAQQQLQLIADGSTIMVCFDYEQQISVTVPQHIRKRISDFENGIK